MTKTSEHPRKALGKGLSALLAPRAPQLASAPAPVPRRPEGEEVLRIPVTQIDPNPLQSRTIFQAEKLDELAQSIKANGVIQPLIVRRHENRYQLVAGERRWRASKIAGLTEVPVVVQNLTDEQLLEVTLIENIQREDLTPIEVAHAFERLVRELGLSHDEIGRRTGKDRSTITNLLRLLRLPPDIQQLLTEHRLSMGHARAILGLPSEELQRQVAEKASAQGLSVRQVERLIQRMTESRETKSPDEVSIDPNVKAAIDELERVLGTRVRIQQKSDHRGRIEIEYYSTDDLDRIYTLIVGD
ncbi:MAG TPA: ParB/RepB/Spo0J family partition protein [Bryobacteraceae bacterium]|nr:ParB/RepB/Spo0J family partition protein [Bryobacteraceae bacterium]